jgi:hypothetical protein
VRACCVPWARTKQSAPALPLAGASWGLHYTYGASWALRGKTSGRGRLAGLSFLRSTAAAAGPTWLAGWQAAGWSYAAVNAAVSPVYDGV